MTFEEILDQAMAMLQRRGRLTYRTLQRQFQLDDAALEDLKNELIKGQRLAVDEDGDVLVWTGSAPVPPLTPPLVPSSGHSLPPQTSTPPRACPDQPRRSPLMPNAASSPCCSAIWWIPPPSPAASTPKTCGR